MDDSKERGCTRDKTMGGVDRRSGGDVIRPAGG